MNIVLTCHGAIGLGLEQKKASILPSVIKTKSERDKSEKPVKMQSKKYTLSV